jgi:hypothetical protein
VHSSVLPNIEDGNGNIELIAFESEIFFERVQSGLTAMIYLAFSMPHTTLVLTLCYFYPNN